MGKIMACWCHQGITWTNIDSKLLSSTPVQFHRQICVSKLIAWNYFWRFCAFAKGQWLHIHVFSCAVTWLFPEIGQKDITTLREKKPEVDIAEIIITMTSQWVGWRLKSPASRLFTQPFIRAQIKENIKAPRHWPLCGEFTGDRWIPRTNGQ